jgi:2-oxoisovalerate dehydrogenase E1 component
MTARRRSRRGHPGAGDRDRIVATYREHGHALVRGVPMPTVMAEMYGKAEGCSGGRGGSMHLFDAATKFYGGNAIVGGGLPLAGGLALADKMRARTASRPASSARRGGRGRVPRDHEPRRAVGPPGSVRLREQWLRHGHGHRALRNPRPTSAPRRPPTTSRRSRRRHGRGRRRGRRPPGHRRIRETGGPISSNATPTASAPIPCSTRSSTATRTRSRSGASKGPIVRFQGWLLENRPDPRQRRRPRSRPKSMPRSRKPWPLPRPARGSRWRPDPNHVLGPSPRRRRSRPRPRARRSR